MEQIPFYMTFPMQNLYVMEMEYEKDIDRMKSLYPTEVADIQAMVEERCDELEYEGGRIFDEEPDRYMIQMEIMSLYNRIIGGDNTGDKKAGDYGTGDNKDGDYNTGNHGISANKAGVESGRFKTGSSVARKNYFSDYFSDDNVSIDIEGNLTAQHHRPGGFGPGGFGQGGHGPGDYGQRGCDNWLCSMVGIMFTNEIYRRRCRHRRCNRWW